MRSASDVREILRQVNEERERQDRLFGEQNHWDTVWSLILGEEYGELQKEILERECSWGEEAELHDARIDEELVQLVAVGIGWLEARARRRRRESTPEARERRATAEALFGEDTMPEERA